MFKRGRSSKGTHLNMRVLLHPFLVPFNRLSWCQSSDTVCCKKPVTGDIAPQAERRRSTAPKQNKLQHSL